jgi:hypothetical protein
MTATSFKDAFFAEFKAFKAAWDPCVNTRNAWWRVGNALHATLECIVAAHRKWPDNPDTKATIATVRQMLDQASNAYTTYYDDPGVWFDDYGWWGIAFLAAYENFGIFAGLTGQTTAADCLKYAHDSWQEMYDHAWQGRNGNGHYGIPIGGGCWNKKDSGAQNTVTNALYLTLSIRLYAATKDETYLNAACEQFLWFGLWYLQGPNRENDIGLFDWTGDGTGTWILERPTFGPTNDNNYDVFNNGDPHTGGLPAGFADHRKQYWTGDQGLMIAGCVGMYEQRAAFANNPSIQTLDQALQNAGSLPTASAVANFLASEILKAAADRLFTPAVPYVLHEGPMSPNFLTGFSTDYAVGKGVLMRYTAFAYGQGWGFDADRIIDTAKSILQHPPGAANLYGLIWDDKVDHNVTLAGTNEDGFNTSNDDPWQFSIHMARLDALTAAVPWAETVNLPT